MTTTPGERIEAIRNTWGRRLLILGHHYQRADVLRHADAVGDSLELARRAARETEAERIVFCGVHFMAESAVLLASPGQAVYMPDVRAGCPMANMAGEEDARRALAALRAAGGDWAPVVYVNSTAAVKAFCGREGGSACTSSNAAAVMRRYLDAGRRVLFLPDRHLGTNTAHDLGLKDEDVLVFDRSLPGGGLDPAAAARAPVAVWNGYCIVHVAFTLDHLRRVRERFPDARIIVHPEAPREVVRAADAHGSTAQIVTYVEAAPPGSTVVVGTELNLVDRLAAEHRGRVTVLALHPSVCANMAKTNEQNLLELLEHWAESHRVRVPAPLAADARSALERMLSP